MSMPISRRDLARLLKKGTKVRPAKATASAPVKASTARARPLRCPICRKAGPGTYVLLLHGPHSGLLAHLRCWDGYTEALVQEGVITEAEAWKGLAKPKKEVVCETCGQAAASS